MKCECGGKMRTIASVPEGEKVYRRRKCDQCGRYLYTIEAPVDKKKVNYVLNEARIRYDERRKYNG